MRIVVVIIVVVIIKILTSASLVQSLVQHCPAEISENDGRVYIHAIVYVATSLLCYQILKMWLVQMRNTMFYLV